MMTRGPHERSRKRGFSANLGSVGVRASVGHREDARAGVLQGEVLVLELLAVDRLAAGPYHRFLKNEHALSPLETTSRRHAYGWG